MSVKQASLIPSRTVAKFVENLKELTQEVQEFYLADQIPFVIGYSGGKDSTSVLQLIWNALLEIPLEQRHKKVYVITTDTLVENPIVTAWVNHSLERMGVKAKEQQLPIEPHLLKPEAAKTYWVGLIGKGYPAPRHRFRWCTTRLKIDPSNNFIRNIIRANREATVVLGTRKTESANRAAIMSKRDETKFRDRLCPHPHLPSSRLYTPIEEWTTEEVWMYLMQWENPWGHSNKDLFAMYRGATADNECPLVIDTSTPSCGSSRFGCWVCTLVESDKSLTAMIQNDEEKEWLQPLVDFRLELDIRNDRHRRDFRRIHGNVQLFERNLGKGETAIEPIPGPYTKKWREYWLRKVLEAQVQVRKNAPAEFKDISLITPEELSEIRRIWLEEKHEFDDSLPKIYQEVTGEEFQDMRKGVNENKILGDDEWEVLQEICDEDAMHLELMSRLLDTERQYYTKTRRVGIYESLTKCFDSSSRNKEEAIKNAHDKRDIMAAAIEGNVAEVKEKIAELNKKEAKQVQQLSWGNIKFKSEE